jgi:hypothetical protein
MIRKVFNWKITLTILCFVMTIIGLVGVSSKIIGSHSSVTRYYLKQYTSQEDLFYTLINRPDYIFLWCCDCILYYAKSIGVTYEQLNVFVFVIIQPMLILMFFTLFVIQSFRVWRR